MCTGRSRCRGDSGGRRINNRACRGRQLALPTGCLRLDLHLHHQWSDADVARHPGAGEPRPIGYRLKLDQSRRTFGHQTPAGTHKGPPVTTEAVSESLGSVSAGRRKATPSRPADVRLPETVCVPPLLESPFETPLRSARLSASALLENQATSATGPLFEERRQGRHQSVNPGCTKAAVRRR